MTALISEVTIQVYITEVGAPVPRDLKDEGPRTTHTHVTVFTKFKAGVQVTTHFFH